MLQLMRSNRNKKEFEYWYNERTDQILTTSNTDKPRESSQSPLQKAFFKILNSEKKNKLLNKKRIEIINRMKIKQQKKYQHELQIQQKKHQKDINNLKLYYLKEAKQQNQLQQNKI